MPRLAFDDRGWRMEKKKRKSIEFKRAVNENAAAELDRQSKTTEIIGNLFKIDASLSGFVSLRPRKQPKKPSLFISSTLGGFGDAARRRKMLKIYLFVTFRVITHSSRLAGTVVERLSRLQILEKWKRSRKRPNI